MPNSSKYLCSPAQLEENFYQIKHRHIAENETLQGHRRENVSSQKNLTLLGDVFQPQALYNIYRDGDNEHVSVLRKAVVGCVMVLGFRLGSLRGNAPVICQLRAWPKLQLCTFRTGV